MHQTIARLLVVFLVLGTGLTGARAQDTYLVQAPPPPPPAYGPAYGPGYAPYPPPISPYGPVYRRPPGAIFGFGYRGMFTGALAGLGISYFAARDSHDAWRAAGLSVGFGALAGTALGLSLGIFDQLGLQSAYYISRDLTYGVLFGALVGAIAGGVAAIGDGDGNAVLFGAATGSLAGLGLGLLTGAIEGPLRGPRGGAFFGGRARFSVAQVGADARSWGVRVSGRL